MIDINKKYKTRDGSDVRILCTDRKGDYPVVALIGDDEIVSPYSINGRYCNLSINHPFHLIEVPETRSVWVNVYPNATYDMPHKSKELADEAAIKCDRLACVELTYEVPTGGAE